MRLVFARVAVMVVLVAGGAAACRNQPDDPREALANAERYQQEGRLSDSIVELRRALQIDPMLGEARLKLAAAYEKNDDPGNATREYTLVKDAE